MVQVIPCLRFFQGASVEDHICTESMSSMVSLFYHEIMASASHSATAAMDTGDIRAHLTLEVKYRPNLHRLFPYGMWFFQ